MSDLGRALADVARELRLKDAVDVAILTFVLWRAYVWLRGTVALQVALGMLTLVAAAFAAKSAGLVLTGYVLQAIGAVSVLVAVVIFREEIRRALGRASPLRWWRERRSDPDTRETSSPYGPLAEGLFALARKRIGALIVVPRRDPIEEHITGGTRIDALTSPQLLEAIFHESSPVHDGAVIVDGPRLRVAGTFLPLTSSTELPESYGTRHRAAAGITERCDAVVLVVSEERGEVSLSLRGRLVPQPPSAAALARRLDDLLREAEAARPAQVTAAQSGRRRRRRQAIRDALVGVAILGGVVAAWATVAGGRRSVIVKTVPVELRGVAGGLELEPPQPNEVEVHLRGPRRLLLSMTPADLQTSIDMGGLGPGVHELRVTASAPPGIEVVRVTPQAVRVEVLERRTLPVEVQLGGAWPRSLKVRDVLPREIEVIGKPDTLGQLADVKTRPISRAQVTGNVSRAELVLRTGVRLADERQAEVVVVFEDVP